MPGGQVIAPALLAGALAELHEGLVLTDASGRVIFANDKAAQLLREQPDALRGKLLFELFPLAHRMSGQRTEFPASRLLDLGESIPLSNEYVLARGKEAEPQPIIFSGSPVRDADGRVAGAIIVFRNPLEMTLTPE